PSLNVPGKLDDPVIEVFNSAGVNIAGNDDWKTDQQNVEATGLAPTNDRESAIVITLDPGAYTVVMRGKNNSSGIGVVDMFDIGLPANARLANVSSRGVIGTGDNILIGGFFAGPQPLHRHSPRQEQQRRHWPGGNLRRPTVGQGWLRCADRGGAHVISAVRVRNSGPVH